jgi:hypothetical protein
LSRAVATATTRQDCYCDLWDKAPEVLEAQGVRRGYCGICGDCGAQGHTRHYPGPVPFTGAWCDACYGKLPRVPLFARLMSATLLLLVLALVFGAWMLLRGLLWS